MDPRRAFGRPRPFATFALTHWQRITAQEPVLTELADLYDLTIKQVDEALRYELIIGRERIA